VREITYVKAFTESLMQLMAEDDNVVIIGEDVGSYGGVFHAFDGLWKTYGDRRVIDTPISEMGFLGMGVGAAATATVSKVTITGGNAGNSGYGGGVYNAGKLTVRLCAISRNKAVAGGGDDGLAEADAAVVARDAGVGQDAEAAGLQAGRGGVQQEHVLEHAAGQGDRVQAVALAQQHAAGLDGGGDPVVEAGGDDGGTNPGR